MSSRTVAVLVVAVTLTIAGCSSSDGVDRGLAKRLRVGFTQIEKDRTLSIETSVTRDVYQADKTLSCLQAYVDPRYPSGDHVAITNWGSSTTLDTDGGCLGGGDPHGIVVLGDIVYVEAGEAPKGQVSCLASYRRERMSAAARAELSGLTRSQGVKVDDLLNATEKAVVGRDDTVTLDIDRDKAAALSRTHSGSTATRPDSMTVTVTFAGQRSSRITNVAIETTAGDDTLSVYANYSRAKPADAAPPAAVCVEPGVGTLSTLDQLKTALGL